MSKISLSDLQEERNILTKDLAIIEKKLSVVNLMIDAYYGNEKIDFDSPLEFHSKMVSENEVPYDDFPYHQKWIQQILYLLDKKGRFLSNHELAESLMPYYQEYNIDKLKRKVSVNISAAYKKESIDGLIKIRVSNLPKGNVWGYAKWLDSEGQILEKYRPFDTSESKQMTIY